MWDREWKRGRRAVALAATALTLAASRASGQSTPMPTTPDSAECERIVGSARVDSVPAALFIDVHRIDGYLDPRERRRIAVTVATGFVAPVPLRLSVFAGPARTHLLRPIGGDTGADLRAPTITGVYRVTAAATDTAPAIAVVRSTLIIGLDAAVLRAIRGAVAVPDMFRLPDGQDTMRVDIRLSTDSIEGSLRIVSAIFPRLPVVDAVALAGNPPAVFPRDSTDVDAPREGEVVLRFVVARSGEPTFNAIEVVRATSPAFVRAALEALPKQRFRPATVKGCPVAQEIDYPFTFGSPPADPPDRH